MNMAACRNGSVLLTQCFAKLSLGIRQIPQKYKNGVLSVRTVNHYESCVVPVVSGMSVQSSSSRMLSMSTRQTTEKKEVGLLTPLRVKTKKRIPPHVMTRRRNLLTRVVGNERNIRHSPWRMNLVCQFIAGMTVPEALIQLDYCEKKRGAPILKKVLQRTVNLADIQHSLAPSQLTVEECFATQGTPLKRLKIMGRGRSGVKHRKHSHIRLVLAETDFALKMAQAPNARQEEKWYQRLLVAAEDAKQKREEQEKLNALLAEKEKKQAEQENETNKST